MTLTKKIKENMYNIKYYGLHLLFTKQPNL